ncbi:MAG: S1 RNA-binding domain-containing protein [Candidatus Omnitrophica bacterium]|nr:S1 RNA-binding domain-containing protein [Candidatus Omnitrophota bacterium]
MDFIAEDLSLGREPVHNTVRLILEGGTVPFIARYRKERTGGLDETVIRGIQEKLLYYSELEKRKETVVRTIDSQEKLTPGLAEKISACREKQELEDIYLPFKPKRVTKATRAREKGLDGLAYILLKQPRLEKSPEETLLMYVDPEKDVHTPEEALEGATDILVEAIVENTDIRGWTRDYFMKKAVISTRAKEEWKDRKSKFDMYYSFKEYLKDAPAHRLLAIRRGSKEEVISWDLEVRKEEIIDHIRSVFIRDRHFPFIEAVEKAVKSACVKLTVSIKFDIFFKRMEEAEKEAIKVFSKNLRNLLLEPPAGHKVIMGIDPGFRTGCKVAVIDKYGNFLEFSAIYPHEPAGDTIGAAKALLGLLKKHEVELVAVGNGTASRETYEFTRNLLEKQGLSGIPVTYVSEAGASVYSASEKAAEEFPQLDVTVRGAISIARRLQDPLSELVKIDPRSIGVGQYQHDIVGLYLERSLKGVVESCVNFVGVELNTASRELLSYVAGIGPSLAGKIVEYREKNGPFPSRGELLEVPSLGEKAFQQSAGFLRIRNSGNPLDNSAIHPERYGIVERMAGDHGTGVGDIVGNTAVLAGIDKNRYVTAEAGLPTIEDILEELKKPGLDPRKKFVNVRFRKDIQEITDLKEDMRLFGKITNVTDFGAFVDIGVHQDGLIHISRLSRDYVKDPHDVVSAGDVVRVKVLSVDPELKRISLERISR